MWSESLGGVNNLGVILNRYTTYHKYYENNSGVVELIDAGEHLLDLCVKRFLCGCIAGTLSDYKESLLNIGAIYENIIPKSTQLTMKSLYKDILSVCDYAYGIADKKCLLVADAIRAYK